jgi:NAD(P)-dependent dehydrogenase (short-subunit alcohol dehydrogenase family)
LPYLLRAAPGVLINLSSGLGRFGVRQVSAYCASKFAIEGFTQSLADEHPGTELVVMAVSPGMVATDMLRAYLDTQDVDAHLNPDRVGAGFVQLLEMANPGWTGRSVDIEEFLSD